ncbi:hypothetical protein P152DRAFT_216110 [Eremomyces bilateralis CBS 781.70]|uniref:Uncharacterized protein n=1 Tax=Eremomyces bilateralis CBS 781.70 TaxID=1392243 RepID=A0A6G1FS66_9PEZI|nr:uncharacterized protein P152DRAFT_216110 [Eremomyces bilateralis CBS 781.70]KAF1808531.1 hypothetical protein P152DRAFT_216110 [Eremomyces bilateralis CBS 781.70]
MSKGVKASIPRAPTSQLPAVTQFRLPHVSPRSVTILSGLSLPPLLHSSTPAVPHSLTQTSHPLLHLQPLSSPPPLPSPKSNRHHFISPPLMTSCLTSDPLHRIPYPTLRSRLNWPLPLNLQLPFCPIHARNPSRTSVVRDAHSSPPQSSFEAPDPTLQAIVSFSHYSPFSTILRVYPQLPRIPSFLWVRCDLWRLATC